ncbi:MAG: hypothetical protein ACI9WU_001314 [Myxococcota bacterium]|jgi:hypothetical protein
MSSHSQHLPLVYSVHRLLAGGRQLLGAGEAPVLVAQCIGDALARHRVALHAAQTLPDRLSLMLTGTHEHAADFLEDVYASVAAELSSVVAGPVGWDDRVELRTCFPDAARLGSLVQLLAMPVLRGEIDRLDRWHLFHTWPATVAPLNRGRRRRSRGVSVAPLPRYRRLSAPDMARRVRSGVQAIEREMSGTLEAA